MGEWNMGKTEKVGIALIMVISVIAALVIIATPFALSMRFEEKSGTSFSQEMEAQFLGESMVQHQISRLQKIHSSSKWQKLWSSGQPGQVKNPPLSANPRVNTLRELDFQSPKNLTQDTIILRDGTIMRGKVLQERIYDITFQSQKEGKSRFARREVTSIFYGFPNLNNPQGAMVDIRTEDEQGKIDINTAPPRVMGVLLGATILARDITMEDTIIPVMDIRPFYTDHNPNTYDGLLRIGNEYIAYSDVGVQQMDDGSKLPVLKGCLRGLYLSALWGKQVGEHKAGTLIYDARGLKISFHPLWRKPGE
ncbi:MAG: hypothetical protein D6785_08875, partial [Planctomycetota bacterium]